MFKYPNQRRAWAIATSPTADRPTCKHGFLLVHVPHQSHPTCSGCNSGSSHSTISSQTERTSCEGLRTQASTSQVTKATTSLRKVPIITKASLVEVTLPSTSLVVSTIAMATRRTTTVPTTKEWKLKGIQSLIPYSNPQAQALLHWRGLGQRRLKATPKGPARTAQRELRSRPRRRPNKLR